MQFKISSAFMNCPPTPKHTHTSSLLLNHYLAAQREVEETGLFGNFGEKSLNALQCTTECLAFRMIAMTGAHEKCPSYYGLCQLQICSALGYVPSEIWIISPMIIKMGHITIKKVPFLGVVPGWLKCQDC